MSLIQALLSFFGLACVVAGQARGLSSRRLQEDPQVAFTTKPPGPPSVASPTMLIEFGNCTLPLANGSSISFDSCFSIPHLDPPLIIMWSHVPASNATWLQVGLAGITDGQGWVAIGFPFSPGVMLGASAYILQDAPDESTGASIGGYFLASASPLGVQPPSKLTATDLEAASFPTTAVETLLTGAFLLELTPAMAARSQLDIIFAAGPLSRRTGGLLQHSQYGSARLGLDDGSISAVEVLAR